MFAVMGSHIGRFDDIKGEILLANMEVGIVTFSDPDKGFLCS